VFGFVIEIWQPVPRPEVHQRNRLLKPINLILLGLLVATQYALWFGDKNAFDLYRLKQSYSQQEAKNEVLAHRNQTLVAEVIDLKQGGEAVETIARSQLGLIKQGESFYQIIE